MYFNLESIINGIIGGGISGLFTGLLFTTIFTTIFLSIGLYIYTAFAWMTIAKKMKCKEYWLAWIPLANFFLLPILLKKEWTWGFMIFVPIANVVFFILWTWKIFEKRKYPGWFSLSILIPKIGSILYLIAIGFIAWKDKKR